MVRGVRPGRRAIRAHVAVTYVELSEDKKRRVPAALDPLAAKAEAEASKPAEDLRSLK
jgi:hypothetical protein